VNGASFLLLAETEEEISGEALASPIA